MIKGPRSVLNRKVGYQASPQPNRIYVGPAVPIAYDANWQLYTNLTPVQIAWFQAQPEWLEFVNWVSSSPSTATINASVPAKIKSAMNK